MPPDTIMVDCRGLAGCGVDHVIAWSPVDADLLPGQRRRSLLSHEDSPFVGRLHELGLVRGAVAEGRLVTLSGEAGIGKTRLAQHFANEQRSAYATAGGVWFCDLRDARDAEAMCSTLARTLNIADEATIVGDGAVTAVGRALATRGRALVVLHAVARAAREQRVLRSRHRDPPRPS